MTPAWCRNNSTTDRKFKQAGRENDHFPRNQRPCFLGKRHGSLVSNFFWNFFLRKVELSEFCAACIVYPGNAPMARVGPSADQFDMLSSHGVPWEREKKAPSGSDGRPLVLEPRKLTARWLAWHVLWCLIHLTLSTKKATFLKGNSLFNVLVR